MWTAATITRRTHRTPGVAIALRLTPPVPVLCFATQHAATPAELCMHTLGGASRAVGCAQQRAALALTPCLQASSGARRVSPPSTAACRVAPLADLAATPPPLPPTCGVGRPGA